MMTLTLAALIAAQASTQAAPATAQTSTPPSATMSAAQAFGRCVELNGKAAPETVTPEAAAHAAMGACTSERMVLDRQFQAVIAGPGISPAARAAAQQQYDAMLDTAEKRVAARLRESRAAAASPKPQ